MIDIRKHLPSIHSYEKKTTRYILPDENSSEGQFVPDIVLRYGKFSSVLRSVFRIGPYLAGCIRELKRSYKEVNDQPESFRTSIDEEGLCELKEFIFSLGIDEIGWAKTARSDIFSNQKIVYPNAIVLLMHMDQTIMESAPSKKSQKEIFRTYYALNRAVNSIKRYLNENNFHGEAGPALGGEVKYPHLAQKANLGAVGKSGLLITPTFGPCIRIAAVFTDIENLPFSKKNEYMWIRDFCKSCNRCVTACPSHAIEDTSDNHHLDYTRCAVPFSTRYGCSICINSCTFFKSPFSKIRKAHMKHTHSLDFPMT